ncbi:hypothetical protein, partial [Nocardia sp. NPDC004711]
RSEAKSPPNARHRREFDGRRIVFPIAPTAPIRWEPPDRQQQQATESIQLEVLGCRAHVHQQERRVVDKVGEIIETTVGIGHRPVIVRTSGWHSGW